MRLGEAHKLGHGLDFTSFLIAFGESASRARNIINSLTITSIAALLGLFNSLMPAWNWFPSRQEKMREFYHVAKFVDDSAPIVTYRYHQKDTTTANNFIYTRFKEILLTDHIFIDEELQRTPVSPWINFRLPEFVCSDQKLDTAKLRLNKKFVLNGYDMACISTIATRDEMDRTMQAMNRAKLENSTFVRFPILGIAFDVNWLVIVSGIGFSALYFLLYYSLNRERKNIKLLFKIAEYEQMSIARLYQFMSMQQVFTIPQSIDEYLDDDKDNDEVKEKSINPIQRLLFSVLTVFPFICWLAIFVYDLYSRTIGVVINQRLTDLQFSISICIGLVILLFMLLCILQSAGINKEWRRRSQQIGKREKERVIQEDRQQKEKDLENNDD